MPLIMSHGRSFTGDSISQSLGILTTITYSEEEIGKAIAKVTPVSYSQKIVSFI